MKPNKNFLGLSPQFWALVKLTSESLGYSDRKSAGSKLRRFAKEEVCDLKINAIFDKNSAIKVTEYLNYRACTIENDIYPLLMDRDEARTVYSKIIKDYTPKCYLPQNKQKGKKNHPSYLTCIVNIITEQNLQTSFDDKPSKFTIITDNKNALATTLSRWIDGAYPSTLNPKAIWEIKEYYGTTTFGSRVADGVYETQLDGYEINAAEVITKKRILHYLIVDDKFTWWVKGKSYLCRLVDLMHMGFVDEVIFGKEVLSRWPEIIRSWGESPR